ncbi:MAG TPA: site-2 protease family protein [Gammaproteobacteria bacterium]|nr:site-2 protease family protein [Gammaproteobacteria bacterium]
MQEFSLVQKIIIWAVPVLFAITVHEVAHGWVALRYGDTTAKQAGRLTLNPIKHIDPVGTLLVPGIMLALGGFIFGWARPVPVNFMRLNNPKRDMVFVAIAGPATNLIMAFIWGGIGYLAYHLPVSVGKPLLFMSVAGIYINAILMFVNLIPLPPLDGGRVAVGLLPNKMAMAYSKVEPYGLFIMIALLASGMLGTILWPPLSVFVSLISNLFSVPVGQLIGLIT